jgi:hypothetical protein
MEWHRLCRYLLPLTAQDGAVIDEDLFDDMIEKLDSTADDGPSYEIDGKIAEDVGTSEEIDDKIEEDEGVNETIDEDASIEELDGALDEDAELGPVTSDDGTLTRVDCCGRTMAESGEAGLLATTLLVTDASLLGNLDIMTDPRVLVDAGPNSLKEIRIITRPEFDELPDTEETSTRADCCGSTTVESEKV